MLVTAPYYFVYVHAVLNKKRYRTLYPTRSTVPENCCNAWVESYGGITAGQPPGNCGQIGECMDRGIRHMLCQLYCLYTHFKYAFI